MKDKFDNKAQELKGKAKDATGKAIGNEQMQAEGKGRSGCRRHQAGRREAQGHRKGCHRPSSLIGRRNSGAPERRR